MKTRERVLHTKPMPSKSGYKGVRLRHKSTKYQAYLAFTKPGDTSKTVTICIPGSFDTPEEAYIARCKYLDDIK